MSLDNKKRVEGAVEGLLSFIRQYGSLSNEQYKQWLVEEMSTIEENYQSAAVQAGGDAEEYAQSVPTMMGLSR